MALEVVLAVVICVPLGMGMRRRIDRRRRKKWMLDWRSRSMLRYWHLLKECRESEEGDDG